MRLAFDKTTSEYSTEMSLPQTILCACNHAVIKMCFFFFFVPDGLRGLGEVGNHDAGSTSRWTMTSSIGPALVCVWRTVFVHHDQRPFLTQEKTPGEVYRKPV